MGTRRILRTPRSSVNGFSSLLNRLLQKSPIRRFFISSLAESGAPEAASAFLLHQIQARFVGRELVIAG
ncbi:hypothetical protein A8H26_09735 [Pluralibacter gergoviae]|nr:hypothetical protein A8H26_09735 [Pluralibacter gergoviae]